MKSGHFGLNKYPRKESPLSKRYLDLHLKVTKNGKCEFLEIEIGKYTPKMWEGHFAPTAPLIFKFQHLNLLSFITNIKSMEILLNL